MVKKRAEEQLDFLAESFGNAAGKKKQSKLDELKALHDPNAPRGKTKVVDGEKEKSDGTEIMLRLNSYEYALFSAAAEKEQRKLRDWMRIMLINAAESTLKENQ